MIHRPAKFARRQPEELKRVPFVTVEPPVGGWELIAWSFIVGVVLVLLGTYHLGMWSI